MKQLLTLLIILVAVTSHAQCLTTYGCIKQQQRIEAQRIGTTVFIFDAQGQVKEQIKVYRDPGNNVIIQQQYTPTRKVNVHRVRTDYEKTLDVIDEYMQNYNYHK